VVTLDGNVRWQEQAHQMHDLPDRQTGSRCGDEQMGHRPADLDYGPVEGSRSVM